MVDIANPLGKIVSEDELIAFEASKNIRLPMVYKTFITEFNGGRPSRTHFSTQDKKVESHVALFLPFDENSEESIASEFESITLAGWLPKNFLPIAITPSGNRVVLSIEGKDSGSVYFWSWDEQDEDDKASYKFLRKICDDFGQFLNLLD